MRRLKLSEYRMELPVKSPETLAASSGIGIVRRGQQKFVPRMFFLRAFYHYGVVVLASE